MKTHARAVVIGGGVVGVSTLYHLARKGWSDVVLCERTELTAGSTWHAAGLLPLFNMSYGVGQLHKYSVDLYKSLPAETGQDVGFHVTGNLRLATNEERMDEYRKYCGTANTIGVPFEIVSPAEIAELWPLCNTEGLVGALYHPDDGHIAPADVTQAMATGARNMGAEICRDTPVGSLERKSNGEWLVGTSRGDIVCEHVVCATGNYSWHTSQMLGIYIRRSRWSTSTSSPTRCPSSSNGIARDCRKWRCCANPTRPITCGKNARDTSWGLTKKARRRGSGTAFRTASSATCSRGTSTG